MSELEGLAAPPMSNGEVVFEQPWQGRTFGMARALCEAGVFGWDEFRDCLIAELASFDRAAEGEFAYYAHFLRALEAVLSRKGLVSPGQLGARLEQLRARPVGHDHAGHHHPHQ